MCTKIHTLDDIGMFVKFQDKREHLESLQEGKIFTHNIKYYNDLEGEGIADKVDSKFVLSNVSMAMCNKCTKEVVLKEQFTHINIDHGYNKMPVFCLYSWDKRNINEIGHNKFSMNFNSTDADRILKEFGEYALLIKNRSEFIRRLKNKINTKNDYIRMEFIQYADFTQNEYNYLKAIAENRFNSIFWKDKNKFKHQQEYRVAFMSMETEDTFDFDIGSIKDISTIMRTEELLKSEFKFETY